MARNDALHELIRNLDKGETRHFRLLARMHYSNDKKSDYEELFDLIAAQEEYNEAEVQRQLSNKVFAGNLSVGKNYLYRMILKSQRHYHSEKNIYFQVREMWMDVSLLMSKGLHKHALKILNKALNLCSEKGLYAQYFDLSDIRRRHLIQFSELSGPEELNLIKEAEAVQYARLGRLLTSHHVGALADTGVRSSYLTPDDWEDIKTSYSALLEEIEKDGQVKHDVLKYYLPMVKYHNMKKEFDVSYAIQKKILDYLVNKDDTLIKAAPLRYFNFCLNFFNVCTLQKSFPLMKELLERMNQVQPQTVEEGHYFKTEILYSEVLYYTLSGDYESIISMEKKPLSILKKAGTLMPRSKLWATYINISSAYMSTGLFSGALDWLNLIFQEQDNVMLPRTQFINRIYMTVCHIELGNFTFLEYLERNIVLFLRHQQEDFRKKVQPVFDALRKYIFQHNQGLDLSEALELIKQNTDGNLELTAVHRWAGQKLAAMKTP
jgi:hypothetical protein